MRRIVMVAVGVVVVAELGLLVSDRRILVSETLVKPGQSYEVEGWGDLGKVQQASLVCRYFTGRDIKTTVLWYSENNVMGRDACQFIRRP